jgi:hypothetical protein
MGGRSIDRFMDKRVAKEAQTAGSLSAFYI